MADDEWSTSANDAINITFFKVGAEAPEEIASFHPEYTEQQFGKDQSIFGYKELEIDLKFASHDLYPNFSFKHGAKWKTVKDAKATDIREAFKADISADAFGAPENFENHLRDVESASQFKPPGKLIHQYTKTDRNYEVYSGELTDDAIRKFVERIQVLIPLFIDGGIPVPVDDPEWSLARWRVWLIYEKLQDAPSAYSIVGYCTAYRFLPYQPKIPHPDSQNGTHIEPVALPPSEPISVSELPNRSRISQFLILPHHQGQSHGQKLYETVIKSFLADPACIEVTVEDPNEQFDDMRDLCDYARLSDNGTFSQIHLNLELDPKLTRRPNARVPTSKLLNKVLLEQLRKKNKLAPRQFQRLVEMYLLSQIPTYSREAGTTRLIRKAASSDKGDKALYYWRLLVKQRIYKQHREVLKELEQEEKVDKLEETVNTQWIDFERILLKRGESNNGERSISSRSKRKILDDDDDDDELDTSSQASKRVRG